MSNGLDDEDINGQVIICTDDPPAMVEVIVPLDTYASTSMAFSHAYNYFHNDVIEDVMIVAINVSYQEIDGVESVVLHIFTRPFRPL